MTMVRRLFTSRFGPNLFGAKVITPTMTIVGVITFFAGVLYLPSLAPTRIEMVMVLLLLAAVTLLCHAVGQLAAILERLETRQDKSGQ